MLCGGSFPGRVLLQSSSFLCRSSAHKKATSAAVASFERRTMATASHYGAHSADSYEKAYFYEAGAYMQHLVDLVSNRLQLEQELEQRRILDIGGGTGNFAQALVNNTCNTTEAIVVDPFLDPTSSIDPNDRVKFVKEPAEAFLEPPRDNNDNDWWRKEYHQVLLKEIVHHLKEEDRVGIFRGMYQGLVPLPKKDDDAAAAPPPSLLIITRPQIDIDYPLWDAARTVWRENQPSAFDFQRELKRAGFTDISATLEAYPCQISLERWQSMVRQRFWSTFSNFSDDELNDACQQIVQDYKDRTTEDGILHFEDRLVFISARKAE